MDLPPQDLPLSRTISKCQETDTLWYIWSSRCAESTITHMLTSCHKSPLSSYFVLVFLVLLPLVEWTLENKVLDIVGMVEPTDTAWSCEKSTEIQLN